MDGLLFVHVWVVCVISLPLSLSLSVCVCVVLSCRLTTTSRNGCGPSWRQVRSVLSWLLPSSLAGRRERLPGYAPASALVQDARPGALAKRPSEQPRLSDPHGACNGLATPLIASIWSTLSELLQLGVHCDVLIERKMTLFNSINMKIIVPWFGCVGRMPWLCCWRVRKNLHLNFPAESSIKLVSCDLKASSSSLAAE